MAGIGREIVRLNDQAGELLGPADDGELSPWAARNGGSLWVGPVIHVDRPAADDDDRPALELTRRRLQRQPSVEVDFGLPALQAFGTALAVTLGVAVCALAWDWSGRVVAAVFALSLAAGWFWRLRWVDGLLWSVETLAGRDVNHDGVVGRPARDFALVNPAAARAEADQAVTATEREAERAELLAFVHRCYTVGCSEASHGVKATGPDRAEYVRRRDALLALGIARWRSPGRPRAGWVMAVSYKKALELVGRHVL